MPILAPKTVQALHEEKGMWRFAVHIPTPYLQSEAAGWATRKTSQLQARGHETSICSSPTKPASKPDEAQESQFSFICWTLTVSPHYKQTPKGDGCKKKDWWGVFFIQADRKHESRFSRADRFTEERYRNRQGEPQSACNDWGTNTSVYLLDPLNTLHTLGHLSGSIESSRSTDYTSAFTCIYRFSLNPMDTLDPLDSVDSLYYTYTEGKNNKKFEYNLYCKFQYCILQLYSTAYYSINNNIVVLQVGGWIMLRWRIWISTGIEAGTLLLFLTAKLPYLEIAALLPNKHTFCTFQPKGDHMC